MKEDLAISKNTILSFQEENHQLRLRLEQYTGAGETAVPLALAPTQVKNGVKVGGSGDTAGSPPQRDSGLSRNIVVGEDPEFEASSVTSPVPANLSVTDLSKKLHDERSLRSELEKELEVHVRRSNKIQRNTRKSYGLTRWLLELFKLHHLHVSCLRLPRRLRWEKP